MKKLRILSMALLAVTFVLGSCSKYEEGPALSLRTKKARLTGQWKIEKYVDADGEESEPNQLDANIVTEFTEDNSVFVYLDGDEVGDGTWEFTDSKEGVIMDVSIFGLPSEAENSRIIKLRNDEVWMTQEEDYNESSNNYGGYTVYIPA